MPTVGGGIYRQEYFGCDNKECEHCIVYHGLLCCTTVPEFYRVDNNFTCKMFKRIRPKLQSIEGGKSNVM